MGVRVHYLVGGLRQGLVGVGGSGGGVNRWGGGGGGVRRRELVAERRLLQVTTIKANFIETLSTVSEEDEQQKHRVGGIPVSETCGGGGSSVGWV